MRTYRVTYSIDIDEVESPVEAAMEAHDTITGPDDASLYSYEVQEMRDGKPLARHTLVTLRADGTLSSTEGAR